MAIFLMMVLNVLAIVRHHSIEPHVIKISRHGKSHHHQQPTVNHHHHHHHHHQRHNHHLPSAATQKEDAELQYVETLCSRSLHFTPCACFARLTNVVIHKQNEDITVEFPEFRCDDAINKKREEQGRISVGYRCKELTAYRTLYEDVNHKSIEVRVKYSAGCEIRCLNPDCRGISAGNSTTSGKVTGNTPVLVTSL